jgi:uncharacterized protein YodC (DUF2158 family)
MRQASVTVANFLTPGDAVQMKSGGPLMTVSEETEGSGLGAGKQFAKCKWWNGTRFEDAFLRVERLIPATCLRNSDP